jgi:membrane protein implicated in regulation of membrane protease activity
VLGLARAEQAGLRKSSSVARFIGALRMGVYFSLGAGPTGLVALATKIPPAISLLWAGATGVAIALLARALRKFLRRDLDSSFKAEDFLLEEATITVPVAPGLVGRAMVRKFGAQAEVYVRATSGGSAYERGARVRIIDYQDDVYIVENADEEHLVR